MVAASALTGEGVDRLLAAVIEDEFRAAEALDPGNPLYPVESGVTLVGLGRRDEACAAFRRGAEVAGGRPLPLDAARHAAKLGCPLPGTR